MRSNNKETIKKLKTIELGMTKEEMKSIMGEPLKSHPLNFQTQKRNIGFLNIILMSRYHHRLLLIKKQKKSVK
jgi:hypothetical protein